MIAQGCEDINEQGVIKSSDGKDSFMAVGNGKLISILNPKVDDFDLETISSSLAKQCRFNGHCSRFYSVGEHTVRGTKLAMQLFNKEIAKEFLFHDATEAYLGDMIRPLKRMIPRFSEIEQSFWKVISDKWGLPYVHSPEVQYLDNVMVTWEKRDLMPNSGEWPGLPDISLLNLPDMKDPTERNDVQEFYDLYSELFVGERTNA